MSELDIQRRKEYKENRKKLMMMSKMLKLILETS